MAYKGSDPFYHTPAWIRLRAIALQRDGGLCQDCLERVRNGSHELPRRATCVHHIIPRQERPELALCLENLRSCCSICHNRHHPEKGRRQDQPANTKPNIRIIKV